MKGRRKNNRIMILLVVILAISLGYALIATTLKITGTSIIKKQRWNVYWDNAQVSEGSKTTDTPVISQDEGDMLKTKVSWTTSFVEPGDFYEFTIDAVNAGSIDAKISEFETKVTFGDKKRLPKYLTFTATYVDGTEPEINDLLEKASNGNPTKKKYKIRMEYDGDKATADDINNMPSEGITVNMTYIITYSQGNLTYENKPNIERAIARIEADPDSYRNPQQSTNNKDIGLDADGNVINLDLWWGYNEYEDPSEYYGAEYVEEYMERTRGYSDNGDGTITLGGTGVLSMATASASIVHGEMTAPIPAYIMLAGDNSFIPVTRTLNLFSQYYYDSSQREHITKIPDFPETITEIGDGTFASLNTFKNITIPKHITVIGGAAFSSAFGYDNNTLTFEDGSQLTKIESNAFSDNNLVSVNIPETVTYIGTGAFANNGINGNLILPEALTRIGAGAFGYNNLTSVTLPSTTECFKTCGDYGDEICSCEQSEAFDSEVTLIHY